MRGMIERSPRRRRGRLYAGMQGLGILTLAVLLFWGAAGAALAQIPSTGAERVVRAAERTDPLPFGANLFAGQAPATTGTIDPNYRLTVGDDVAVFIIGAVNIETITQVDSQGNIFIPEVGPVPVSGVTAGALNSTVEEQVRGVFRENVEVYTTVLGVQQIAVFVTGFVAQPGRFEGGSLDSIIDYLTRAGGVDPDRGSYRDIVVERNDQVIARADLYGFLLGGDLPRVQFRTGDTIVVGPQRPTIAVTGDVRNNFRFEVAGDGMTGSELIDLARPLPGVTDVYVTGIRQNEPFVAYFSTEEFTGQMLSDQDDVVFQADQPIGAFTLYTDGAVLGPSVLVASPGVRLHAVLDHIAVDPAIAAPNSVFLFRESVAVQQARSLQEALDRLERSLLSATSAGGEAQAQALAREAELVQEFIQRARTIEPDGRVVVARQDGSVANIRLEDGDIIVVPEATDLILISGEVAIPQALLFETGLTPDDYVVAAGGYTDRADEGNFVVRRLNGQTFLADAIPALQAGDEIIVLPEVPLSILALASDVAQIIGQLALTAAAFVTVF